MSDTIKLIREANGIAVIQLSNPPLNVVSRELTLQLAQALKQIESDSQIRVLIVTGEGNRAFCAGANIKEFAELVKAGTVIVDKLAIENYVYDMLDKLPIPTIAAINGIALGGGAELALCCDIRVMEEQTQIGFPECKLGVFPGSGGTQRLPQLIGEARAKELMYIGDSIDAETAFRIGLINRMAPEGKALEAAMELALKISLRSGVAMKCIKQAVDHGLLAGTAAGQSKSLELSEIVFKSEDIHEGIAAFYGKRSANFKHR